MESIKLPHRPILISIVHLKFAKYLRPIIDKLSQEGYAYLVNGDLTLERSLIEEGEECVIQHDVYPSINTLFLSSALRRFENLVEAAENILAVVRQVSPRCLVVVEGNAPHDMLVREVGRLLSIPTYCIQQGWSPVVHTGFRNMDYDLMFVWGKKLVEILAPFNPEQKFLVSGSHALDVSRLSASDLQEQSPKISFFLQSPCALLSTERYIEFMELVIRCAVQYPQAIIVVRAHPSYPFPHDFKERIRNEKNVILSDPGKDALGPLIKTSTLVVSVFSTVLMEAIALGTVPLICNIGSLDCYEPDLVKEGLALEARNIEEALDTIGKSINLLDYLSPIKDKINDVAGDYFFKGDAAEMICQHIVEAVKSQ